MLKSEIQQLHQELSDKSAWAETLIQVCYPVVFWGNVLKAPIVWHYAQTFRATKKVYIHAILIIASRLDFGKDILDQNFKQVSQELCSKTSGIVPKELRGLLCWKITLMILKFLAQHF